MKIEPSTRFSAKQFEIIAASLRRSKPYMVDSRTPGAIDMAMREWEMVVEHMVDALEKTNKRFNVAKFLKACDYTEGLYASKLPKLPVRNT